MHLRVQMGETRKKDGRTDGETDEKSKPFNRVDGGQMKLH